MDIMFISEHVERYEHVNKGMVHCEHVEHCDMVHYETFDFVLLTVTWHLPLMNMLSQCICNASVILAQAYCYTESSTLFGSWML